MTVAEIKEYIETRLDIIHSERQGTYTTTDLKQELRNALPVLIKDGRQYVKYDKMEISEV